MYCPNCGSNNQAEIKFCTRCGTNLAVVSEALGGKPATQLTIDERKVKLLKDYYSSRRSTLIGVPLFIIGLLFLTGLIAADLSDKMGPLLLLPLACAVYGAICTFWGIGHWVESASEMKALGYSVPQKESSPPAQAHLAAPADSIAVNGKGYVTDPVRFPGSVTENTTRQLDQDARQPNLESQSKRTSQ